ncbi:MAG: sugar isomerase [Clostridiales bacterium]|nr:sugar isomerase [Clostridiales bacterium]
MNRKKKLVINTYAAIVQQLIILVSGFILPRLIISHYGSATNGLISSITQFLAFFSMMEMGIGAVVRSSLYKPLSEHDDDQVSRVLISSQRFFRKLGLFLCAYTIALIIYFALVVDHSNGYIATAILVGAIAFSSLSTYLFGIVYQQLLNADQKSYVQLFISALTTILNTGFGVILINLDARIETVKLLAAIVTLLRPLLLKIYVDRHYSLDLKLKLTEEPIKQKWNGLAQHIATYVLKHADTIILTVFSTLENVSIYYVYHLVTNGLQQLIEILSTGMAALLGNMFAKKETKKLYDTFESFEFIVHIFVTAIYSVAGVMILPFVSIYTRGVTDANYIVPTFAVLIVLANASYCLRIPYHTLVFAAGHFKQTQLSSILEASINVVVSIVLVFHYGMIGVAIGTLVAMLYRTIYLAWYLRANILNRPFRHFVQHFVIDILTVVVILFSTRWINITETSWTDWMIRAFIVGVIACAETLGINAIFYRRIIKNSIHLLFKKRNPA